MADKISNYGRTSVDITSTRSRAPVRNERAADSDKAEAGSRSDGADTSSQVRLTDTAANLKQIETRLADLPDVDQKRVATLRQRIESGAYEVNAGRLADRLLAFERDLA
jgi:negative regulator of flagellin synthesis FlgM